jgi:hypothetical protein
MPYEKSGVLAADALPSVEKGGIAMSEKPKLSPLPDPNKGGGGKKPSLSPLPKKLGDPYKK